MRNIQCLRDERTKEIFSEIIACIPKHSHLYLIGGALRNSLHYEFSGEIMPQRDYDTVLIGDLRKFVKNLRAKLFEFGKIRQKNHVVLKKRKISRPITIDDYIWLEIKWSDKSIRTNLKEHANFTFNCNALNMKWLFFAQWQKKVISLPSALQDLKLRKIRVNSFSHPTIIYACIRFMAFNFTSPDKTEIPQMVAMLKELDESRFARNISKVYDYTGGERKARQMLRKLGIKKDIFDYDVIQTL